VMLDLPTISQRASVTQRIGVTDITLTYHRPAVAGRKVFGELIPYDRVWRTGANDNATIEFRDPVVLEGKPLPPGRYGLHMIPAAGDWTLIVSRNSTSWGSFSYDPAEDVLRVPVHATESEFHELLTFEFTEVSPAAATLSMKWERTAVPLHFEVDVHKLALESIRNQLRNLPGYKAEAWADAALYCLDNGIDYEAALHFIDRSIAMEAGFDNAAIKVRLLEATGRKAEAQALLAKTLPSAQPEQLYVYADGLLKENRRDEGLALFATNAREHPDSWIALVGRARAEAWRGDRALARKTLESARTRAPGDGQRVLVERLLKRLEAGEHI
jgi:hypothetical protein